MSIFNSIMQAGGQQPYIQPPTPVAPPTNAYAFNPNGAGQGQAAGPGAPQQGPSSNGIMDAIMKLFGKGGSGGGIDPSMIMNILGGMGG